jgi:chemotaxis protein methyltransferase CheR
MEYSLDFELGVVDYRNIIRVIKDAYDYDFSDYSLTSLKRRLEILIQVYNLKNADNLIEKIKEDKTFFQVFLQEISIGSTEMFRDPSFWRYLRDDILPQIIKENYKSKIWFPSCVAGDELYSFCIILKENGWTEKFEIISSCLNDKIIDSVKSGKFKGIKFEASLDNYIRYQGTKEFSDYCVLNGEQASRDTSLIKNVNFIKQNINFDSSPQEIKLILCRNQLIYFTQSLQDRVLKILYDCLSLSGYLALGIKEQVGLISSKYFRMINETESIYKKVANSV